ncbi:MAG: cytochrome c biogenesis protein ResB [Akkermansiaceae bacterium]
MPKKISFPTRLFRFFSGYGLAVTCLLLLLVLTWFSTLEQPEKGLYEVQKRYYDAEAWFVMPDLPGMPKINGKPVGIPLPGAYLVTFVLFINLFLGGIIRIRKGWKNIGVIISHFSMISLLVAGFVSHHYSKEGIMFIYEDDVSDYAQSYTEYTIEVCEIIDGLKTEPHVVKTEHLASLDIDDVKEIHFPELPFNIKVSHWMRNSKVFKGNPAKQNAYPVVDGLILGWAENQPMEEENAAGCYLDVIPKGDVASSTKLLLYGPHIDMVTASIDGKVYGFSLVREIWPMPFKVRLDSSIGEYYPGTNKPSSFQSEITRFGDNDEGADTTEKSFTIKMNEPMRYGGYTLYQARWSGETARAQSGFAIVQNPSDQWPKYSIYMSMLGLTVHFGVKLGGFITQSAKRGRKTKEAKVAET